MARESRRKRFERRLGTPRTLADVAVNCVWGCPGWAPRSDDVRKTIGDLRDRLVADLLANPVVSASNVCEYLYAVSPREQWPRQDFPSCIPPFDKVFVECVRPSRLFSEGKVSDPSRFPPRWGWFFITETAQDVVKAAAAPGAAVIATAGLADQLKSLYEVVDKAAIERAKGGGQAAFDALGDQEKMFLAMGSAYLEMERGDKTLTDLLPRVGYSVQGGLLIQQGANVFFAGSCSLVLDDEGTILAEPLFQVFEGESLVVDTRRDVASSYKSLLMPALLAVSFMNCKGVKLEGVDPDPRVNVARRRAGVKPFLRYHVIDIEPMKAILAAKRGSEPTGLHKALHLCRSHAATYTKSFMGRLLSSPLTVRRPTHIRGSADFGVVVSDYAVDAPKKPDPGGRPGGH